MNKDGNGGFTGSTNPVVTDGKAEMMEGKVCDTHMDQATGKMCTCGMNSNEY